MPIYQLDRVCVICDAPFSLKRYYDSSGKFKGYGNTKTQTCSRSCANQFKQGGFETRFWSHVDQSGDVDSCHEWQASRIDQGYGRVSWNGDLYLTHRVAWMLANDQIDLPTLDVLHNCDNPPCCNPRHLFLGTHSDNMQDMWDKGRHIPPQPRTRI